MNYTDEEILDIGVSAAFKFDEEEAKNQGLKITLSKNQYQKIILSCCHFCKSPGTTPITSRHKRIQLDRLNRLKHFTKSNTIPCCRLCFKARRSVHPKMIWRVILVNKKLGLINAKNEAKATKAKKRVRK